MFVSMKAPASRGINFNRKATHFYLLKINRCGSYGGAQPLQLLLVLAKIIS
jgi:hypothetical protein